MLSIMAAAFLVNGLTGRVAVNACNKTRGRGFNKELFDARERS